MGKKKSKYYKGGTAIQKMKQGTAFFPTHPHDIGYEHIIRGGNKTVKLMDEHTRNEFVAMMVDFAKKHHLTVNNVLQATTGAVDYMAKNAVLLDEDSQEYPANPRKKAN